MNQTRKTLAERVNHVRTKSKSRFQIPGAENGVKLENMRLLMDLKSSTQKQMDLKLKLFEEKEKTKGLEGELNNNQLRLHTQNASLQALAELKKEIEKYHVQQVRETEAENKMLKKENSRTSGVKCLPIIFHGKR